MRGKKWVLLPHAVEVADQKARANLFAVPGGYVMPVVFGGKAKSVEVVLRGLPRLPGQAASASKHSSRRKSDGALWPNLQEYLKEAVNGKR